eukprot:TRINITY_DN9261_c0_g1_i1.p1 TRINITY_DN9261_c0_g1~~TRINITY_DN9261_c0_g1_i1.p1  ORF type:complete len:255 (+),score=57.87 TRINITY_DN9261_c0_g1_i1:123-887(+)
MSDKSSSSSHALSHVIKPVSPKTGSRALSTNHVFIIGVAGASGSGKTTVCGKLLSQLPAKRICIISIDNYYFGCDPDEDSDYNFDHPDALDFDLLAEHLKLLREGKTVEIPQYDFCTHSRTDKTTSVGNVDVVIVDGIFALHMECLRKHYDIGVFAVEDADVCLTRRIRRDVSERGRSVNSILDQYEKFVKPAFESFIRPSMSFADIIVPRAGVNNVAIGLLIREISHRIKESESRIKAISARVERKRAFTFDG